MYKGIAHLAFTVSDMEESLAFYCDKLGLEKAFSIEDDNGNPRIIYIKICNGQFIELFHGEKDKNDVFNNTIGYSHLCIEVEDINAVARLAAEKGITIDVPPIQGKDTNYQCWIKDPDGNRIEFMQIMETSPQSKASRK